MNENAFLSWLRAISRHVVVATLALAAAACGSQSDVPDQGGAAPRKPETLISGYDEAEMAKATNVVYQDGKFTGKIGNTSVSAAHRLLDCKT